MEDLETTVINFLRDAQWRIAEISVNLDESEDNGDLDSLELKKQRRELIRFCAVLYDTTWSIKDGYNYLSDWTDYEIREEIEYLRNKTGMTNIPFIDFSLYKDEIVYNIETPSGGLSINGNYNEIITFDVNGVAYTVLVDEYAGMKDDETIDAYFAGRP